MTDKVRLLYIEDNEGIARLLQKRMERVGYTVDLAPNGEIGLELCLQNTYDVIIVDYNMPIFNGMQVIQRLAERGAMPPTIMLTGTGNESIAVEALKLGAFDYVVKDIDGVYLDLLPSVIDQGLQNLQLKRDKQLAEEKLEQSEKYYRALIENSPDLIVLTDALGNIRYISPAFRSIFGFHEQEVLGLNGLSLVDFQEPDYIDKSDIKTLQTYYESLLQSSDQSLETDLRIRDRNGSWKWLEIRGRNLLHEPWIESMVFNIRDITGRKLAEEALRESEERFRMLFELAPDPYFINDLVGNLIDCNQAVEPLLGLSKSDLIGKNFIEMQIFDPEELGKIGTILTDLATGEPPRPPELTVNRSDGKKVSIDLRMIPIQTKGETQILGIGHNITWRKQAEMQMKQNINQLETLRQIDDELTRKLDIQYVQSMAFASMLKLSGANAGHIALIDDNGISHVQSSGYPHDLKQQLSMEKRSIVARVIDQQKAEWIPDVTQDSDYVALLPDTCAQMTFPLLSQNRLVGVVSLETNRSDTFNADMFEFLKIITARIAVAIDNAQLYESRQQQLIELQNLYEKISRLEQLKTDMIRLAAHDLRNPLTNILAKTFLLRKMAANIVPEKQQKYLEGINDAVGQMQTMISDFLSVERIEEITQGAFSGNEIDLRELVQSVFADFQVQNDDKMQTYRFSVTESPVLVKGVKAEIQQVIINIIGNAVKYTPNNGTIEIALQKMGSVAHFEVNDTGYGIPRDQQEKMFQPFFRAKTDETKTIDGTGLGLYLVKRIIERNKGRIIFRSEYGVGSTFGFELPIAD